MNPKYLTKRHTIEPYPDGTKALLAGTTNQCTIESQCPCTSDLLHYLVRMENGNVMAAQHLELIAEK